MTLEHLEAMNRSVKQRLRSLNPMQNKERQLLEESLISLDTSIVKERSKQIARDQQTKWVITYTLTNK